MTPQWITQERLAKLGVLARRYRGRCLKEHPNCSKRSHFQWATPHQETLAVPVEHPVLDKETGGIRRDITRKGWKPELVTVWEWQWAIGDNDDARSGMAYVAVEETIASWKADDREQRALDWKAEQQAILDGTYGRYNSQIFGPLTGNGVSTRRPRLDPVTRDQFMAQRPVYYLKGTGIDGMHARPVAVVRVPSTSIYLFIDVSAAFAPKATKNQRRLARRRGKPVQEVAVTVEQLCQQAVSLWWAKVRK
jgi:hypothetical protein